MTATATVTFLVTQEPRPNLLGAVSEAPAARGAESSAPEEAPPPEIADSERTRMPPRASLGLICYMILLGVTNVVIVIPTAEKYAEKLQGDRLFTGLMVSLTPFFGCLGALLHQRMLMSASIKTVVFTMAFGCVLGNVLYALAGLTRSKWSLLVARSMIGLCTTQSVAPIYIGQAVGIERRSAAMLGVTTAASAAFALGPFIAGLLESVVQELRIENLVLDSDTIPGWFMALLYFVFMLQVFLLFENPTSEAGDLLPQPRAGERALVHLWGPLTCLGALMLVTVSTAMSEVYVAKLAEHYWGWSVQATALFMALVMACQVPIALLATRLPRILDDRRGLLVVCIVAVASSTLLFDFPLESALARVLLVAHGLVLVSGASNIAKAFILSLVTKVVPPGVKALAGTSAAFIMCFGRGVGALLGAVMEPSSFAWVQLALYGVPAVAVLCSYEHLRPHKKAS